ncbi:MAG TPA: DUF1552 domain-containing protein [Verrucomicrobiales bacterium]|nr:DUF1552 domain-containing protein [Verrucomicrobiales bacterium]HIL69194.1 DUF1552 domain-containing protein [Verrucomicrobiota bacterium]
MQFPYISMSGATGMLSRRMVLKGAGAMLALPVLEAMSPAFSRADEAARPRRMLGVCNNLGLLPDRFFPTESGRDFELSPYLSELEEHRDKLTVLSGVSHPGVDGSHSSDVSFLTAAPHPGSGGFRNSVSLDQVIAGKVGHLTRFPSLTLGVNAKEGRRSLSWTDSGALIPCENSASAVYGKLFLQGTKAEMERQMRRLHLGESIMDSIGNQSKSLRRKLGAGDRDRLDQYLTAVREVEQRMVQARAWEKLPKPKAPLSMPQDPREHSAYMEKTRLMYRMAQLAFQTDSTRSITLLLDSNNSPTIEVKGAEIRDGYHNLSHHGKNDKKLSQLDAIDREHMRLLSELITGMDGVVEEDGSLLDNTLVLYGSNFGDANKHTTNNMPVLVAGGRLMHGQHLAFDRRNNTPLCNLYVSLLQSMGIEEGRFASSSGTLTGLELAT